MKSKTLFLCISYLLCSKIVFGMSVPESYGNASNNDPLLVLINLIFILLLIVFITVFVMLYKKNKKIPVICPNCEQIIIDKTKFCIKCGNSLYETNKQRKIGKAILSYIFGSLSFLFQFAFLNTIIGIRLSDKHGLYHSNDKPAITILIIILFTIPSIILGSISYHKQRQLFAKIGVILSIVSIVIFIVICLI